MGKSTLFNALTKAGIAAENYPFCTIEPNIGIVEVPDPRLDQVARIAKPQKVIPAIVEFVDIAGLVAGASKGEGLGNQFLANIRETDAIAHVVRCFSMTMSMHVAGEVDPIADIETINTELALADLATVEKQLAGSKIAKAGGDKEAQRLVACWKKCQPILDQAKPARTADLYPEEHEVLKPLFLLTMKPAMYVANVNETGFADNPLLDEVRRTCRARRRAGGRHLRRARSSNRGSVGGRENGVSRRHGDERARPEPPDSNRLRSAGAANLFHRRAERGTRLDHSSGDTAPKAAAVIHTDFETRIHPRRGDSL